MTELTENGHCYHFQGGEPNGDRVEVCCFCGNTREVVMEVIPSTHGPFVPHAEARKQKRIHDKNPHCKVRP